MSEYYTRTQQIKHLTANEFELLRELTHIAKNLKNEVMYISNTYYYCAKDYWNFYTMFYYFKDNMSENFKLLSGHIAQKIIEEVDESYRSYFILLKKKKSTYFNKKITKPKYLPKDGHTTLSIQGSDIRINKKDGTFKVPISKYFSKDYISKTGKKPSIRIKVPFTKVELQNIKIAEIYIIPIYNARFFKLMYTYKILNKSIKKELNKSKALAIDLGVTNFATCAISDGSKPFIIDGKLIKSWNQWYNKKNVLLQSIHKDNSKTSRKQIKLITKRNNRVTDFIHKVSSYLVKYCLKNSIGKIILGYNEGFKDSCNIGKVNNQNFVLIPYCKFKDYLSYKCKDNGIELIIQEESYTSKASFVDNDDIPNYGDDIKNIKFSGKRLNKNISKKINIYNSSRNYLTKNGFIINADLNGAFNILTKSKAVSFNRMICIEAVLSGPIRIKFHDLDKLIRI